MAPVENQAYLVLRAGFTMGHFEHVPWAPRAGAIKSTQQNILHIWSQITTFIKLFGLQCAEFYILKYGKTECSLIQHMNLLDLNCNIMQTSISSVVDNIFVCERYTEDISPAFIDEKVQFKEFEKRRNCFTPHTQAKLLNSDGLQCVFPNVHTALQFA